MIFFFLNLLLTYLQSKHKFKNVQKVGRLILDCKLVISYFLIA